MQGVFFPLAIFSIEEHSPVGNAPLLYHTMYNYAMPNHTLNINLAPEHLLWK